MMWCDVLCQSILLHCTHSLREDIIYLIMVVIGFREDCISHLFMGRAQVASSRNWSCFPWNGNFNIFQYTAVSPSKQFLIQLNPLINSATSTNTQVLASWCCNKPVYYIKQNYHEWYILGMCNSFLFFGNFIKSFCNSETIWNSK